MGSWCSKAEDETSNGARDEIALSDSPAPEQPLPSTDDACQGTTVGSYQALAKQVTTTTNTLDLPANVDRVVAISSFRSQRGGLLKLIHHCLLSLTNSLYADFLIPQDVYMEVCDQDIRMLNRSIKLLDCIEARIEAVPSDFTRIVRVFESEQYLEFIASQIICSYLDFSAAPANSCSLAVTSAVSNYASYLKSVYKKSPIAPVNKWPPTPSKEYIRLEIVHSHARCRDEYIGHILEGNVKEVLKSRNAIAIEQFFACGDESKKLILIEGAPGIGKSTLAWEICKKWEEIACMRKYSLVILLRLREKKVQGMKKVSDLFFSCEHQESLAEDVSKSHGNGVLLVLDGFDELPVSLQEEGFLIELMTKTILPESTVVVTSRPSATAQFLTACEPLIQKHIEVLGFTQQSVEAYAASIFTDPEELQSFMKYISASENPAINSLMYIPINAAIIVQIFKMRKCKTSLPKSLTQLYKQLCLTILNKYMKSEHSSIHINAFKDLPDGLYQQFVVLSHIAFEGIKKQQVIFHCDSVPSNFNHFGFLDSVSTMYGGGEISYNFLHLTLQEFFAAYYMSQLPDKGVALFGKYGEDKRWNVVWQFVAGLTKFHFIKHHPRSSVFCSEDQGKLYLTDLFILSLYEADEPLDFMSTFKTEICSKRLDDDGPAFNSFAVGYCIANLTTKASFWDIYCGPNKEFIQGLSSNGSAEVGNGKIKQLTLNYDDLYVLLEFKIYEMIELMPSLGSLNSIVTLNIYDEELIKNGGTLWHLSKVIPSLKHLKQLGVGTNYHLFSCNSDSFLRLLQVLHTSTVTSLRLSCFNMDQYIIEPPIATALQALIHPQSGTLQKLDIVESYDPSVENFIKLVSAPSSLQHLSVSNCLIKTFTPNNNLAELTIIHKELSTMVKDIVRILKYSQNLKHLKLGYFELPCDNDRMVDIATALNEDNSSLETLKLLLTDQKVILLEDHANLKVTLQEIDARVHIPLPKNIDADY